LQILLSVLFVSLTLLSMGKSLIHKKVGEVDYCAGGNEGERRGYEGSGNSDDRDGQEETEFVFGSSDCDYFEGCKVEE
jgi:hypothetical protein